MAMHLGEAQIQVGATGLDVRKLQEILNGGGYNAGPIDGIFGPQTLAAVKAFQASKNIPADGIVGPITWGALIGPSTPPIPPPIEAPVQRSHPIEPWILYIAMGLGAVVMLTGKK